MCIDFYVFSVNTILHKKLENLRVINMSRITAKRLLTERNIEWE